MAKQKFERRVPPYFRVPPLLIPFLLLFAILFHSNLGFSLSEFNEYQIESAFIYQFTNFLEWPSDPVSNPNTPFVISILGESPIIKELRDFCANKTVKGKKIEINSLPADSTSPLKLQNSKILVVTSKDESVLHKVIKQTSGTTTLIISHANGFGEKGAMINFFLDQDRVKFEINRKAVTNARLSISSRLLYLAKLIE